MAYTLLWIDGFDEDTGNLADNIGGGKYFRPGVEVDNFQYISSNRAFNYGSSIRFGSGSYMQKILPNAPHTVLFYHKHIYFSGTSTGEKAFLKFRDEANDLNQFEIRTIYDSISGTYLLRFYRGSTQLAQSTTGIPVGLWSSLSVKYVCSATTGECTVHLNGIQILTFTGNTQNGAVTQVHRIRFDNLTGSDISIDNLVIATGLATDPVLPECRIYGAIVPTSNAAISFTPSTGTNWSNVDDISTNDDTDYNYSNVVGAKDVFVCSPPTVAGAVLAVRVNYRARKDDAGIRYVKAVIRPGTTDYDGTQAIQPYTTYKNFGETWQTNPDTGVAWTPGDLPNLKFGYKIHS